MKVDEEIIIEPVCCPTCGWFGMSDDCQHNLCPNCGVRVIIDKLGEK